LTEFIKAGKVSIIDFGVPSYSGSKNFSNVESYFTLSLASFIASVNFASIFLNSNV